MGQNHGVATEIATMMTKRSENRKIKAKERYWDGILCPFNHFCKSTKKEIKKQMEGMMYGVRPKDPIDRFEHLFFWWAKLFIVLFALKGIGII